MRRMKKLICSASVLVMFAAFFCSAVSAQTSVVLQSFKTGLTSPIFLTNAGDGTKRIFIVLRGGIINVVQPGTNTMTQFLDISSKISTDGERGLLGLAFHPQFKTNRRFFVYYTRASDGAIQIAEYQASTANANVADTTEKVIITIPHPTNNNHNGGTLAFGPDGYLYAGTGDGGSANDPPNNSQNTNVLLGKFIRLNVDGGSPYAIPADNPFVGTSGAKEIYALGVRNPFRWSFDRGGTHQLYAGDVGQGALEEIDIITKGGNFGWRVYEGTQCTNLGPAACVASNYIFPIYQYTHANFGGGSNRCSIIGGYVYRGTQNVLPSGAYIYGDYCSGEILMLSGGSETRLLDTADYNLVSFGEDEDGELYVIGQGGTINKIVAPAGTTAATVTVGGRVTTAIGRGIRNVVIRMTDEDGNIRSAVTTSFGYYIFTDVPAGKTYVLTAKGKRFTFNQPTFVLNVDDDMTNVNFVANQ